MSDPLDATTPSPDEAPPQEPTDPANLQSAPDLDEDELGVDPLESGVEPAEGWSPVAEGRPTPRDQREGDSIDERLRSEVPEGPGSVEPPLAESRMHELDESIDQRAEQEVSDGATEE
ncbi:hypothetical protein HUO13_21945 [Saccharopolyspora erythraea]|uniref:hypothetical protein n=1 Tax=Saccharopolyspora erythraea TaxID=1836 RepID=UPI001BAD1E0D|nr:hypothetical protein [Saccharopolyspora erythraea]QUH03127.1 hypothetical protein HUO13_21945 [Saccharopolyspora erythraea]